MPEDKNSSSKQIFEALTKPVDSSKAKPTVADKKIAKFTGDVVQEVTPWIAAAIVDALSDGAAGPVAGKVAEWLAPTIGKATKQGAEFILGRVNLLKSQANEALQYVPVIGQLTHQLIYFSNASEGKIADALEEVEASKVIKVAEGVMDFIAEGKAPDNLTGYVEGQLKKALPKASHDLVDYAIKEGSHLLARQFESKHEQTHTANKREDPAKGESPDEQIRP
jgi:hypothetical protein